MPDDRARAFWDARAEEGALYFVDSRVDYARPDEDAFWAGGVSDLDAVLGAAGVEVAATDAVVDVGCGVGRLTRAIAARAGHVTAIDVSPRMLALARERNAHLANVTWVQGDGTSLAGVATASADACVSHVVFQHIPDPAVTLGYVREMGRVLRPGGWAAFQVSNAPSVHAARPPLAARAKALLGRGPRGQAHPNWRGSHVELDALRAAADAGGMDVERVAGEGTQYCVVRARRRSG